MVAPAILLVDDDSSTLDVVTHVLGTKGYRVLVAADAHEAMQAAANYKGPIPLLLTDIAMPGVSGLELRDRISLERRETRILFITAYADWFDTEDYPVLAKPFTSDQLLRKVEEVLFSGDPALGRTA